MARVLGTDLIVTAVRDWIWSKRATDLAALSLLAVDEGEWQVPAPDLLASRMNQVLVRFLQTVSITRDKARGSVHAEHEILLNFLRLLGDNEVKNTLIRQHGEKLANVFLQGDFGLPGYTRTSGVQIESCHASSFTILPDFLLDDVAEIEEATIILTVRAMSYDV